MKATLKTIGIVLLVLVGLNTFAQRKITGIVYRNSEPAAGVFVEANKTKSTFYTSFDGVFELVISDKTKQLKFTYGEESKKMDISTITGDVFNFSFDGKPIPDGDIEPGVVLKDFDQLQKDRDSEFLNNYSLYREYLKQNDFKSAYPSWKVIYKTYPKSTTVVYLDGQKIYENLLSKATDSKTKLAYLDTIVSLYDKRAKYFDNVGEILGRKADIYLKTLLSLDLSDAELKHGYKKGLDYTDQAITKSGENVEPAVLVLYLQSSSGLYKTAEITKPAMLENYERVMMILEKQMANEKTQESATQGLPLIEQIMEKSGALDCAALIDLYKPKYEAAKTDIVLLKKINSMLSRKNCTDNDFYGEISEQLYKLEPTPEAAFNMARMFLRKKDYTKADSYYAEAYNNEKDNSKKASYYYEAAMLALQHNDLQKARSLVREAINAKSDYCEAYMLLGDIYVQASRGFGDGFAQATVFWVACDQYEKAARTAACKDDANAKLSSYARYFPKAETVFLEGLSDGQNFRVEGWINETTRIRVQK